MNRITLWLTVCAAGFAANVFAQVSPQYRDWGNSAVQFIMMRQEKTDWASVKSDADAKNFIELFWARRDPTPDTAANELRQEFETRVAEAEKRFRFGKTAGSMTDRGLVYSLLGQPTDIVTRVSRPRASAGSMAQFQRPITIETWIYKNEAAERVAGTKSFDVAFQFHDEKFAAEFELDEPSKRSFDSTALAIAKSVLKRPFLTTAELVPGGQPAPVPMRLIVVADSAVAHDVLRRAQEGQDFADLARQYSAHESARQGGYVGRIVFADLTDDFKAALAGKEPGSAVLITRGRQFAIVRLLTEAEARAADAEMPAPK